MKVKPRCMKVKPRCIWKLNHLSVYESYISVYMKVKPKCIWKLNLGVYES